MTTEFTRPISRPARLVDFYSSSGTELNKKTKVECIFFPRFNDREETFSLDVLAFNTKEGNDDNNNDDDDDAYRTNLVTFFRTSGFVSRPKVVVYDNWYQRAKEALTPTSTTLSGQRGVDVRKSARYQSSIEEKTKKNADDDAEEEEVFELVWRFSENDDENANEESREEDTKKKRNEMVMMRGSCKMKRVVVAAAAAAEGVETGSAKETETTVLLELLRHASLKYIREKEGNVDLKRANECLRKDQEIAVKEELEKARDIEQFKRKCFEECLVLVNEKKKRIRELEEILETARKENDALSKKIGKGKGGKKRGRSSSSFTSSSSEDSSSSEEVSDEDEEEEANTDDEDKATQIRKRMRQTAMVDTIKTTSDGRKKPSAKPTTTKVKTTTIKATKATASQKSKPAARRVNTFDALMQANLGRDSDANSQSSSF
ncbi:unnamed protein product [Bathycoccus prasinos]